MIGVVDAPRAWGQVRGMARSVGVDLVAAVTEGWMTRAELGAMLDTCVGCVHADDCLIWLGGHVSSDLPPSFCGNGPTIAAMIFSD